MATRFGVHSSRFGGPISSAQQDEQREVEGSAPTRRAHSTRAIILGASSGGLSENIQLVSSQGNRGLSRALILRRRGLRGTVFRLSFFRRLKILKNRLILWCCNKQRHSLGDRSRSAAGCKNQ